MFGDEAECSRCHESCNAFNCLSNQPARPPETDRAAGTRSKTGQAERLTPFDEHVKPGVGSAAAPSRRYCGHCRPGSCLPGEEKAVGGPPKRRCPSGSTPEQNPAQPVVPKPEIRS